MSQALSDLRFLTPTNIQAATIPVLLQNKDIIGQAQTGTGKTAAFAIPVIETLDGHSKALQAVVLCPTRELAMQVADTFRSLIKYKKHLSVVSIFGGQPISVQYQALKKRPQIVVGTPGRMLDHLQRGTLKMDAVRTIILDEADEMLDRGFRDAIESILKQTSPIRQTVLFSATMPKPILELTQKYQQDPQHIQVASPELELPLVEEQCIAVDQKGKLGLLTQLIDSHQLTLSLVFCNTKRQVDELAGKLQTTGYLAGALHGGMPQSKRDKIMDRFRKGMLHVLVATDVAARGIDVQNIQAVFNYDLPEDPKVYVHRIGRTGRAGKSGRAFSFVSRSQAHQLGIIQKALPQKLRLWNSEFQEISSKQLLPVTSGKVTETKSLGKRSFGEKRKSFGKSRSNRRKVSSAL